MTRARVAASAFAPFSRVGRAGFARRQITPSDY
jgi:hypothetical protein